MRALRSMRGEMSFWGPHHRGKWNCCSDACRMCGLCVRNCPEKAIRFEQKAKSFDKDKWKNFLIYVEQERGEIHPVTFELIGEARKMAVKSVIRLTV